MKIDESPGNAKDMVFRIDRTPDATLCTINLDRPSRFPIHRGPLTFLLRPLHVVPRGNVHGCLGALCAVTHILTT